MNWNYDYDYMPMIPRDSEEDVLVDRTKADRALTTIATDLLPNQKFEERIFVDGGGLVYDVDEMTLSGTEMSSVRDYCVSSDGGMKWIWCIESS